MSKKYKKKRSFVEELFELSPTEAKTYIAPDSVIIDIELDQNIFAGSGSLPGMGGEDW